jgi:hypothetical protein
MGNAIERDRGWREVGQPRPKVRAVLIYRTGDVVEFFDSTEIVH